MKIFWAYFALLYDPLVIAIVLIGLFIWAESKGIIP